ncbi:MAG: hypothetical protein JSV88_19190 [Candidatus Aminicenantes bacterium]|nr:MAG: hypothetical protein JSV88_19190 [Candidatus Aminicenantes bacterium]
MTNYIWYKFHGFNILFVLPPTSFISNEAAIPDDMSAKIDFYTKVKIFKNLKGKALSSQGKKINLDISVIIKFLISLMAIFYGFETLQNEDYLKFLSSIWTPRKTFIYVILSRFLLFIMTFLLVMGIVFIFIRIRGVTFNPGDFYFFVGFLLEALIFLGIFFFLGVLFGLLNNMKLAILLIFISWFFINIANYWFIKPAVEPGFPDVIKEYQTEIDKFVEYKNFEVLAEKKYGKFDRKNMEAARKVIEDFWKNYYPKKIAPLEKKLRDMIARSIEKDRSIAKFFPGPFFDMTGNEVSGRGYSNYLGFYDYSIEMQDKFVRFIIDRTYYNDPKIMVNFIKGDEDIFIGKSSLPPNFWTGLAIQYGYLVLIFFAGYLVFMLKMLPKPENARDFDNIEIKFKSGENSDIKDNTNREEFSQQLVNVFFGKCRDLKWKVTMDDKSLLTGKKHDFLFIPKPDQIPDEWKIKHLLKFFKRLFNLDNKNLESLYSEKPGETRKQWLNQFYRELEIGEKASLLISLFMLAKKQVYVSNTFAHDIPGEIRLNLYRLVEEKLAAGSMIIDINRMDSKWMFSKLWQRYYYKKGGYYSLPPLINQ